MVPHNALEMDGLYGRIDAKEKRNPRTCGMVLPIDRGGSRRIRCTWMQILDLVMRNGKAAGFAAAGNHQR